MIAEKKDEAVQVNFEVKIKVGRWTSDEHDRFLEALRIYRKDWAMIQKHVLTRDVKNIRAHAQKY